MVKFDFDTEKFDLYQLTVTRGMLNEIMNVLSVNNHVEVTVNEEGHISFEIPSDSPITIRSINIIQDLVDMVAVLEQQLKETEDPKTKEEIESKKVLVSSAIGIVSDIITYDNEKGDSHVDKKEEKPDS